MRRLVGVRMNGGHRAEAGPGVSGIKEAQVCTPEVSPGTGIDVLAVGLLAQPLKVVRRLVDLSLQRPADIEPGENIVWPRLWGTILSK